MSTTLREAIQHLEYIKRLVFHPNSFSKEEIKDQPSYSPVVKAMKNNIRTPEIIKQKDQDIRNKDTVITGKDKDITDLNTKLTQEQKKNKQLESDKTKLTTDLTNLTNEVNAILTK